MQENAVQANAELIRKLRHEHGWSQQQLAKEADVAKRTIENAEAGKPIYPHTMAQIAGALDRDIGELIVVSSTPESPTQGEPFFGSIPQLPTNFLGRDKVVQELRERLKAAAEQGRESIQVLTAVRGWPGVGKTTLASALARDEQTREFFPDGSLWVSLGQRPQLLSELKAWGRALKNDAAIQAQTVAQASTHIAAGLQDKQTLIIIDDVWTVADAMPFRVGGKRCATLITTRLTQVAESLAPTPGDSYRLDVLTDEQSMELLEQLAPDVVANHREQCLGLVSELEGLPLAIQVAGRLLQAEASRGWGAGELLAEIRQDATRLLEADAPVDMTDLAAQTTPSVAALLKKSTDHLDAETRRRFLRLAPFAPKPATFELRAIAAVWKVDEDDAKRTASTLIDRGLMEPADLQGWFQVHALLVDHAKALRRKKK